MKKIGHWKITDSKNDYDYPIITFYDKNSKILLKSEFQLLAEYYEHYNVWVWGWGLPYGTNKNQITLSKNILDYGINITENDIKSDPVNLFLKSIFTNSRLKITNDDDLLILKASSLYLSKKFGLIKFIEIKKKEKEFKKNAIFILTKEIKV